MKSTEYELELSGIGINVTDSIDTLHRCTAIKWVYDDRILLQL
jgi:hypothetical protein